MTDRIDQSRRKTIEVAIRRGDLETARRLLSDLQEEAPLAVETRGLELELLLREGRIEEAGRLGDSLVAQFPASARVWHLAGTAAYRLKRYAVAVERQRESLRLFPHDRTRRELGRALTQLGELDEAESVLLDVVDRLVAARVDLSWLYERKGDASRALGELERYLESRPDDAFAKSQRLRVRADALPPAELRAEVEALIDLGEEAPEEMLPRYVASLIQAGETESVRELIRDQSAKLRPFVAARMAWECYRLAAWDVALELFLLALPGKRHDEKLRNALLAAARRCGREEEARERLR